MKIQALSRRQLLVSTGASFLLKPIIDCIDARADGPVLKPCFFTMFKGQCQYGGASGGAANEARNWVPTMEGGAIKLSPILSPFEKVKSYMTFALGLDIATAHTDWHHSLQTLFTGTNNRRADSQSPALYESLDYYVARRMGGGAEPLVINPYQAFMETKNAFYLSWGKDATGKLFKKVPTGNPMKLFTDLFGGGVPAGGTGDVAKQAARERARKSMLDAIRADATRIRAAAAPEHRPQVDATLEGIRQLETSLIGKDGKPTDGMMMACMAPDQVISAEKETFDSEANLNRNFNSLMDVTLMALRCGVRSVVSFQFLDLLCQSFIPAKFRPEWKHPQRGVTPYHFDHCHFLNNAMWIEVERYIHTHFARFLEGMMAIPAGGTNLLEKSIGIYAPAMTFNHNSNAGSFFVVGNAGGRLKSNRILQFGNPLSNQPTGKPHNDLLVSALQAFGYDDVKAYGDPGLCHGGLPGFLT